MVILVSTWSLRFKIYAALNFVRNPKQKTFTLENSIIY